MPNDTNVYASMGWKQAGFTDADYIEEFNLDPNQDINKQMFAVVERENIDMYIGEGMKASEAKSKAASLRRTAESNFKRAQDAKKKRDKET